MSASALGERQRPTQPGVARHNPSGERVVVGFPDRGPGFSAANLKDAVQMACLLTPDSPGKAAAQLPGLLSQLEAALRRQPHPMFVISQTVFLADGREQAVCEELFLEFYGRNQPITTYVLQPPCSGASLALEAVAVGGAEVRVEHCGPQALAVTYDRVRWVYAGGIVVPRRGANAHGQTTEALRQLSDALQTAGSSLEKVVRTWFYLGNITGVDEHQQRYQELNRGRTDFYRGVRFCCTPEGTGPDGCVYPASTGIGMAGHDLAASCLSLQTPRKDLLLVPLENPRQTPAYAYHPKYSPASPKFSRAVALSLGDYVTTWISGTASIVESESCHVGDIERQTEQTLDNIENLIAAENFAANGLSHAGAQLRDLAKARIYIKRPEDAAACRAVCERRLGPVPAIYAIADVCRPELLVEIEGLAFSRKFKPRTDASQPHSQP